jgi:hypothetical protein
MNSEQTLSLYIRNVDDEAADPACTTEYNIKAIFLYHEDISSLWRELSVMLVRCAGCSAEQLAYNSQSDDIKWTSSYIHKHPTYILSGFSSFLGGCQ